MRFFSLLLIICILLSGTQLGCTSMHTAESESSSMDLDALWRDGAGYNNPNPERIRNGQRPLNLDGEEDSFENSAKDLAMEPIGAAIGNFIFAGVSQFIHQVFNFFKPF